MGRPHKEGVDYWNIDVDFFQDKKIRLIRSEFGVKGVYISILILNEIYRTGGYYKQWDSDDCLLMSDSSGVAGDCGPRLIEEVVQGLLRRSFFDKGVFERFSVLTSAGIQRRFLLMVGKSRERIPIIQEYFLLDTSDREDVSEATLKKVAFYSISRKENAVSRKENPVNLTEKSLKESKGKEKKEKEKEEAGADAPARPTPFADCPGLQQALDTWLQYKRERKEELKPTGLKMLITRIRKNAGQYGAEAVAEVIRDSMANNYQGIVYDWLPQRYGALDSGVGSDARRNGRSAAGDKNRVYGADEYDGEGDFRL